MVGGAANLHVALALALRRSTSEPDAAPIQAVYELRERQGARVESGPVEQPDSTLALFEVAA